MSKILFLVTEDWYFYSHRLPLAIAAKKAGHEVVVLTRVRDHGTRIREHGIEVVPLGFSRRDRNPFKEAIFILRLARMYRHLSPDLVHHVALKPVLYGSLAALLSGRAKVINAIAGLGYLFVSRSLSIRLLRPWITMALRFLLNRGKGAVIVQNSDDAELLIDQEIVSQERLVLIRGSGVDTGMYCYVPEPTGFPVIVLPARLLWSKGVGEFIDAAKVVKRQGISARFVLVGEPDVDSPDAISLEIVDKWQSDGIVEWWGRRDDMPSVYAQSHIVCLPSYREGLPKSLLEAAACSRPIVTTDVPGCREIVRHEENGFLVPVRDVDELARALINLIGNSDRRKAMGERGREIAISEFRIEKIVEQTLALYKDVLN